MLEYFNDLAFLFKNKVLNALGVERTFLERVQNNDIAGAINMMQDNDDDVDIAIEEYYPEKHKVMRRPNKPRKNMPTYITEKLPRKRQQFINEVALFFLLNKPVEFQLVSDNETDNEAFKLFKDFLNETHFNATMRLAKRIAGAETESAKLYHIYRDNSKNEAQCRVVVLGRSLGYQLRALIDQYGIMTAFAYGYTTKDGNRNVHHWDIQTADFIFNCTKRPTGWRVETLKNPTGKINIIYYKQKKEWDGVQPLCEREESIASRLADNNNYFSDPIAKASADVIQMMGDPNATGKMIQMQGQGSVFEYVTPPQQAQGWNSEKEDLKSAILNDSFTPDFTYEGIKGYGTLSGSALRNAMTIGFIKRNRNLEVYDEAMQREISVIKGYLQIKYPQYDWNKIKIIHRFAEPFVDDEQTRWSSISNLYSSGVCSLETAVNMLSLTENPEKEVDRIRMQAMELEQAKTEMQTEAQAQQTEEQNTEEKQTTEE